MPELFQEDTSDSSAMEAPIPSEVSSEPPQERASLTLLQNDKKIDEAYLQTHKELVNNYLVGNDTFVEASSSQALSEKNNRAKERHLQGDKINLQELNLDLFLEQSSWDTYEWVQQNTSKSLFRKQLEGIASGDEEEVQRVNELLQGLSSYQEVQIELRAAQEMADALYRDTSTLRFIGEIGISLIEPLVEVAVLQNVTNELTEGASLSGFILPSESVEQISSHYAGLTPGKQAKFLRKLVEGTIDRKNQLGIAENKTINHVVLQTIINTLKEGRKDDDMNLYGVRNFSDLGLNLISALDILGARDLLTIGKKLISKMFRPPKTPPRVTLAEDILQDPLKEKARRAKKGFEKLSKAQKIDPNKDIINDRASILDMITYSNPSILIRMADDIPLDRIDEAIETLGTTREGFNQRLYSNISGGLDEVSLPPAALDPRLQDFWADMRTSSPLTVLGYAEDRGRVLQRVQEELRSVTEGVPHPSRSYVIPPASGDFTSLGTAVVRFGSTPSKGFTSPEQAQTLVQEMKANGLTAKAVRSENDIFVEVERKHILTEKDSGVFSSIDGERLTVPLFQINKHFAPWSETVLISESMNPQRMVSWAIDKGEQVKADLLSAGGDFFKVAKRRNKIDFNDAWRAIETGEREMKVWTPSELREISPGISRAGQDAYYSYRSTVDGIRLVRSQAFRRKLARANNKLITTSGVEYFGKVLPEPPRLRNIEITPDGKARIDKIIETDDVYGTHAWDPITREQIHLSQDFIQELYSKNGRIIKLSSKIHQGEEDFSYLLIKNIQDVGIEELPAFPNFGREGYAIERFYDQAGFIVEEVGIPRRLNGINVKSSEAFGVVKTKAQAKKLMQYFNAKFTGRTFKFRESRELESLLDEAISDTGGPSWLKQRKEDSLVGELKPMDDIEVQVPGFEGLSPTKDTLVEFSDSLKRSLHGTADQFLADTESILTTRWMNQYKPFMKDSKLPEGFPIDLKDVGDVLDPNKIKAKGLDVRTMKNDARTLHYNISALRSNRFNKVERAVRATLADASRRLGAREDVISKVASETLLTSANVQPFQYMRGVTSTLNIGWGLGFQLPQNILTAIVLMSTQGRNGAKAMVDGIALARGLMVRNKGAEFIAQSDILSQRLGVSRGIAQEFIQRFRSSGVFGNAGEVDNLLRHISDVVKVHNTNSSALKKAASTATAPIKKLAGFGQKAVAKSIDVTMLGYWSAAFRKQKEAFESVGKRIGTEDFWESVRQNTRKLSQNQNSSDLLSFERRGNPLAAAMQFTQHLFKLGHQGLKVVQKAGGLRTDSVFAGTQDAAIKGALIYTAMTGAGGWGGRTGVELVHSYLPDDLANAQDPIHRTMRSFILGGMVDVIANSFPGEGGIAVSSSVSPGGSVDIINRYFQAIRKMHKSGELNTDIIEAMAGASAGTFSNIYRTFLAFPGTISSDALDTPEKIIQSLQHVADLTKTGGDINVAVASAQFEAQISKMSSKTKFRATLREAFAKSMGFPSYGEITRQGLDREIYLSRIEEDRLVKNTGNKIRKLFVQIVNPEVPESLDTFNLRMKEIMDSISLIADPSSIQRIENGILQDMAKFYSEDKGAMDVISKTAWINSPEETEKWIKEYMRLPSTSEEDKESIQKLLEVSESMRKEKEEE